MNSNDFVIRTERSVIDVVLSNEGKIDALRRDFEDFKRIHHEQYTVLTSNQQILSSKLDNLKDSMSLMQNIFTWGFAAVAIGVAIAPIVKSWFDSRKDKALSEEISRQVDAKFRELSASQKRSV